jgi:hypothetical protein
MADRATKLAPYVERLVENGYAQERLSDAASSLQAAYERASKRRVKASRDEKLRRQVRDAAQALSEATNALRTGRKKPKKRWGRRLLVVLGLGALAGAAALAVSEDLRKSLLGSGEPGAGEEPGSVNATESPAGAAASSPAEGG